MRILIVLPGALGDVLRGLPLLGRLRAGLPGARLGWVVEPLSAPLLAGHPWLDVVHVFARRRGLAALPRLLRALRAEPWDVALDLGRGAKSALLARASGAPDRPGFARADAREGSWLLATRHLPEQGPDRSKLEQFLAFGDLLGVPPSPPAFGLVPTPAEAHAAAALLAGVPRPLVAACVGSSCPSRRWLVDRTAAVLHGLATRHGAGAVVLGTAADATFADAVVAATGGAARSLAGRTTLRELLAVLAVADVAIGPDSGALHLAAALGRPVVSLWGATSALRSTPWGATRWVVSGTAPCAPCFLTHCPIERVCMRSITADTVLRVAEEALAA